MFNLLNTILHLDQFLLMVVNQYSTTTYGIIFLIIFLETGLVITPFLPGDSLLFTAGAISATSSLNLTILLITIFTAAVMGDALNYQIGKSLGPKVFKREQSILLHPAHLIRAQKFYEKYGKKTIIIARFVPILRTFAPFVAGIGKMPYPVFLAYNIIGAALWCLIFIVGGYLFGNIPWVQKNFGLIILLIIIISILPIAKEFITHLREKKRQKGNYSGICQEEKVLTK